MFQTERRSGSLLEGLNRHSTDIASDPLIEDLAQKRAVLFRGGCVRADAGGRRNRLLDSRQKTQILTTDAAEEPIYCEGSANIQIVHNAEDVGGNMHFAQEFVGAHRLGVSGFAASCHPIRIVKLRRAVQAETYAKTLAFQKATPFFIQQNAVGLDAVPHAPAGGLVLALKIDSLLEEAYSQDGGLPSVPREVNLGPGRSFEVLDDIFLQQAFRHMECAGIRIEDPLVPVIAVLAIEVAHGARRLDKDLKLAGNLTQCSLLAVGRRRKKTQYAGALRFGNAAVRSCA